MPYEGEFAHYNPLRRIAENVRVKELLSRSKVHRAEASSSSVPIPTIAPDCSRDLPRLIVAIDGSDIEVPIVNGYPGAMIGYCTVASVLIDLALIQRLDTHRPIDPLKFRETEEHTEEYKYKILEKLNNELNIKDINPDNILEIVNTLQKNNPQL